MKLILIAVLLITLPGCGNSTNTSTINDTCDSIVAQHRPSGRTRGGEGNMSSMEKNVLTKTNRERTSHGKQNLKISSHLNYTAFKHSYNMAIQNQMSHELDGDRVADRSTRTGYIWGNIAENIAKGHTSSTSVVDAWMNSTGHRQNILDERNYGYTNIGVGAYKDSNNRWWYTQVFGRPHDGYCYE